MRSIIYNLVPFSDCSRTLQFFLFEANKGFSFSVQNGPFFMFLSNIFCTQKKHTCSDLNLNSFFSNQMCESSSCYSCINLKYHFKACLSFVTVPVAGDTQKSSSHFHCLKCEYYCTDTNKVVAHRRQHQKLDSIMAAGFEKFTPTQFCPVGGCPHNGKQTHYHCSKCQYAVLGLSQMEGHKYRHMNEWNAHYALKNAPTYAAPLNFPSVGKMGPTLMIWWDVVVFFGRKMNKLVNMKPKHILLW